MSVLAPVTDRLGRVPPVAWFGAATAVALAVLVWHRYCCDAEDTDWLDPGQPPVNVSLDMKSAVAGVLPKFRPVKPYTYNTLQEHPGCWVGDC